MHQMHNTHSSKLFWGLLKNIKGVFKRTENIKDNDEQLKKNEENLGLRLF